MVQPAGEVTLIVLHWFYSKHLQESQESRLKFQATKTRVSPTLLRGPWSRISVYKMKIKQVNLEGKMAIMESLRDLFGIKCFAQMEALITLTW